MEQNNLNLSNSTLDIIMGFCLMSFEVETEGSREKLMETKNQTIKFESEGMLSMLTHVGNQKLSNPNISHNRNELTSCGRSVLCPPA